MFIILNPHTAENTSDKFRLVHSQEWANYRNGASKTYSFTEFATYPEAKEARDKANQ